MTRKEFLNKAIFIKGEIINNCNIIEFLTNFYLSNQIVMKNSFFGMALINKINFNDKISLLKQLLSEDAKKPLDTYPDLISSIDRMQKLRNKFAHSIFQIENVEDYTKLDQFTLLKTDKFDAKDFGRTAYKISEHKSNIDSIWKTIIELSTVTDLPHDFIL